MASADRWHDRWQQWLSNPERLRAAGLVAALLVAWTMWTVWWSAQWFYQALFLLLMITTLILITRPAWYLNLFVLLLVGDVSGVVSGKLQLPGLLGAGGIGGNTKIPELLSLLGVFQLVTYGLMRPAEFRQPLIGRAFWFIGAGVVGTVLGVRHHVPTEALRDSLGYYFAIFFVMGMVLLRHPQALRSCFRTFFYASLGAVLYQYGAFIVTRSSAHFYSHSYGMFYAVAAYFLIAKIFAAPPGARRWLCGVGLVLFTGAIFIGRARGSVIGFLVGLIPLFLVLRPREQFQVTFGVVLPGAVLMVLLFLLPARQRVEGDQQWDLGERRLEVFTRMGDKDYDPTGSYRLDMWRRAFAGFLDAPVFGKGYGWRIYVKRDYNEEAPAAVIHNSYLHTLVCGGIFGAIPLALLVGGCLLELGRRWRRAEPGLPRLLAAACFSTAFNFFLMAVTNVGFEIVVPATMGWVLVAMAIQVSRLSAAELAVLVPYRRRAALSSGGRSALRRQVAA